MGPINTRREISKRRLLGLVSVMVSLGLVGWLVWRLDRHRTLELIRNAHGKWLLAAAGLTFCLPFLATARWLGVLRAQPNARLPYGTALRAVMVANALNSFLPSKAGDIAKAVYLRRRANFSMGLGTVILERLVDLAVLGALGVVGAMVSGVRWGLVADLTLLGAVIGAFGVVCLIPAGARLPLPAKLARAVSEGAGVFHAWLAEPSAVAMVLTASLIHWSLNGLIVCSLVSAVGAGVAWGYCFSVYPLALLAGLVPATIGGIGTRDAAFVALLSGSLPREEATLVSLGYTVFAYWLLSLISFPVAAGELLRLRSRQP